jgi:hypothetical protein
MIYALLDASPTIQVDHMRSAKALWDYCRESAEYIFHGFEADPVATKILQQVQKNGEVEWKDLYPLFSNHASKSEIDTAVNDLIRRGKLVLETLATGGRPRRILRLAQTQANESQADEPEDGSTETTSGEQSDESEQSRSDDSEKWTEEF